MDYLLEKRPFAKTITGASIDNYLLTTSNTSLRITDFNLKLLATKTYNTKIIQSEIVERNNETYVIVLQDLCRFEIMKFEGHRLRVVGLKYFEHSKFHIAKINLLNSLDVGKEPELNKRDPFFIYFGNYVIVRISTQFLAIFDYTQEIPSHTFDAGKDLNIKNIIKFTPIRCFTLQSVLFLCDYYITKRAFIYSYDDKLYKITDFAVANDVYNVEALRNGICFVFLNECYGLILTTIKNPSVVTKIEMPDKINDIRTHEDVAFVFCDQAVFAVDVTFMHDRIKSYRVTKLIITSSQFGCVTSSHIFVGSQNDDSYLFDYSIESEDENDEEGIEDFEAKPTEISASFALQEANISNDIFDDLYTAAPISTTVKDIKTQNKLQHSDIFDTYKDLYNTNINQNISNIIKRKKIKHILGKSTSIKNHTVTNICKMSNDDFIGVSRSNAIIFTDKLDIQLMRSSKIKGFDRLYSVEDIYCLTNARETIFCKWEIELTTTDEVKFLMEEETLEFGCINGKYCQITKDKLLFDYSIIQSNTTYVEAKIIENKAYTLTSTKELYMFDGTYNKMFFSGVELLAVDIYYVLIISQDKIHLFKNDDLLLTHNLKETFSIVNNNVIEILDVQEIEIIVTDVLYIVLRTLTSLQTLIYDDKIKTLICIDTLKEKIRTDKKVLFKVNKFIYLLPDKLVYFCRNEVFFHNINNKLDYVNNNFALIKGNIVEYQLNTNYDLGNYKASKKSDIGDVASLIDYNEESETIAIIKKVITTIDEKQVEVYTLNLYTKDIILIDSFQFNEFEYVTDIKYMYMNENVKTDLLPRTHYSLFLVCTLSVLKGYDELTKGRIIVFEIKTLVGQTNKKINKKINPLADLKISSNVTSCQEVRGNIAVCQGTRLMVYKFDRLDGLTAIAFSDMQIICTSISTVKNYMFVGDILRGTSFFYLQHKPVKIHKLSMSECIQNLQHVSLLKLGKGKIELLLLAFDEEHMHIYTYSPNNVLSKNGEYLIKRNVTNLKDRILGSSVDCYYSSDTLYYIRNNNIDEATLRLAIKKNRNISSVSRKSLSMVTVKPIVNYAEFLNTDIDI